MYQRSLFDDEPVIAPKPTCSHCSGESDFLLSVRGLEGKYCHSCRKSQDKRLEIAKRNVAALKAEPFIIFDTETTGLHDKGYQVYPVSIAIIDHTGVPLVDTYINPEIQIPADASKIHGITNETIKDAPTFRDLYPQIYKYMHGTIWAAYNSAYDTRIIQEMCKIYELPCPNPKRIVDVMPFYAFYWGEISTFKGVPEYKWQKLSNARDRHQLNVGGGADHGALTDTLTTLALIDFLSR